MFSEQTGKHIYDKIMCFKTCHLLISLASQHTPLYTFWLWLWHALFSLSNKHWNKCLTFIMYPVVCRYISCTFDYSVYSIFEFAWTFDINMKDTRSAVSSLTVFLQPLNPRQALVKRLSVVNLENFRRQYARRRWKVKYNIWSTTLCFSSQPSELYKNMLLFPDSFSLLLFDQQLSFRIVALCNHLTRIMKKGHKLPEQDGVRTNYCTTGSNGSIWT